MSSKSGKSKGPHSSIFHRIHQRHDARHHPGEDRHSEQRQLLQEEHPDSASEHESVAPEQPQAPSTQDYPRDGLTRAKDLVASKAKSMIKSSGTAVTHGASRVAQISKQAFAAASNAIGNTSNVVKRNPKIILIIMCIMLAAASFGEGLELYRRYNGPAQMETCTSADCVHVAHNILESIDPHYHRMNPCTNFDDYVCGGFQEKHDLDEAANEVSRDTIKLDIVRHYLHGFLQRNESDIHREDRTIFRKAKDAYHACQNQQKMHELGLAPLKALTDEVKLLFSRKRVAIRKQHRFQSPVNTNADHDFLLTIPYLYMLRMGVDAFVTFTVEPDARDSEQSEIYVGPADLSGLMLTDVQAFDNYRTVQEYESIIEHVLAEFIDTNTNKSMNSQRTTTADIPLRDLARGIVRLETRINSIRPSTDELQNLTESYHIKTYEELQAMMPYLAVGTLIDNLAPNGYNGSTLIVTSPRYLKQLSSALSATSMEVLQAFCIWRIIQTHSERVEHKSLQEWKKLSAKIGQRHFSATNDRWRDCIDTVDEDLGLILLRFLVQDRLFSQSKDLGSKCASNVRNALFSSFATNSWMGQQDLASLLYTTADIELEMGYPAQGQDLLTAKALEGYYRRVDISNDTFLTNKVQSLKNKLYRQWSRLSPSNQDGTWSDTLTAFTPYLDTSKSLVVLPAAEVQPPYLTTGIPRYITYSTLGVSAGYYLTWLSTSRVSDGIANGSSWTSWSQDTKAAIEAKTTCFKEQYEKIALNERGGQNRIDEATLLQQDIIATGAVHAGYRAWAASERHEVSARLPGLEGFTPSQLFWLSYGTSLCSKKDTVQAHQNSFEDSGLQPSMRLKATIANSQEFKQSFNCPDQGPVCELW